MLVALHGPGRQHRGPVDAGALTPATRALVEGALSRTPTPQDPGRDAPRRLVVLDGLARHLLDPTAAELAPLVEELDGLAPSQSMTACAGLAALADLVAAHEEAATDPELFLTRLGDQAAGIRPGLLGLVDLAQGGHNPLAGGGFESEYDDHTAGQARHFAGVAAAATRLGGLLAREVSEHVLGDAGGTADGRLTEKALEFARALHSGKLPPARAGDWIRAELCAPGEPDPPP